MSKIEQAYADLELTPSAIAEVKASYRRLSLKFHPDKNDSPTANDDFVRVSNAVQVITRRDQRSKADFYKTEPVKKAPKKKPEPKKEESDDDEYGDFDDEAVDPDAEDEEEEEEEEEDEDEYVDEDEYDYEGMTAKQKLLQTFAFT
jgi:DnaJ-class molecular chaperone